MSNNINLSLLQDLGKEAVIVNSHPEKRHHILISQKDNALQVSHIQRNRVIDRIIVIVMKILYSIAGLFKFIHNRDDRLLALEKLPGIVNGAFKEAYEGPNYRGYEFRKAIKDVASLYGYYDREKSKEALAAKYFILEAAAEANRKLAEKGKPLTARIEAAYNIVGNKTVKNYHTPLIRMETIDEVLAILKDLRSDGKSLTIKEMCQKSEKLRELIVREDVPHGMLVELLYRHTSSRTKLGKIVGTGIRKAEEVFTDLAVPKPSRNKILKFFKTFFAGNYADPLDGGTLAGFEKLLKFFKTLGISPATVFKGELYAYSEMFTRGLRDEESLCAAFGRSLKGDAAKMLLRGANEYREMVQAVDADANVVISDAFCRLRIKDCPKGSIKTSMEITGKVMNDEGATEAAIAREKDDGGNFLFSLQNMFGWEKNVDLEFDPERPHIADVEMTSKFDIERLYRRSLSLAVNREDSWLAIQRLAPSDYHHFVETVGGRVLSVAASCEKLCDMCGATQNLQEREQLNALIRKIQNDTDVYDALNWLNTIPGIDFGELKTELERGLSKLKQHCHGGDSVTALEAELNSAKTVDNLLKLVEKIRKEFPDYRSKVAVEIRGTCQSVSSLSTKEGAPLSQNDRKIVVIEHKDGSISVHAFVGAVVVNNVNISGTKVGNKDAGEDWGDMEPGQDVDRGGWDRLCDKADSIHYKKKSGEVVSQGAIVGSMEANGSTVISIYFKKDFVPKDSVEKAYKLSTYRETGKAGAKREMEIQATLGDVIGVSTAYAAFEAVRVCAEIEKTKEYWQENAVADAAVGKMMSDTIGMVKVAEIKEDTPYPEVLKRIQKDLKDNKETAEISRLKTNLENFFKR